ncbi:ribosomal protein L16 [Staphylococcus aureus]
MGAGKGAVEGWIAVVKPGRILFELLVFLKKLRVKHERLASHKLPVMVEKREELGGDKMKLRKLET